MQENVAKLYPNPETSAKVMDYSIAHSTPLPDYLVKYHQWGCEKTKVPSFLISTYQAQMLIFLARIVGVKRGELESSPSPCIPPSILHLHATRVLQVTRDINTNKPIFSIGIGSLHRL